MALIDDEVRTCVVHGRFRGPPLVYDSDKDAIYIGGEGTLTCHPAGLTVEGRQVSELWAGLAYVVAVVGLGAWLLWLHCEKGIHVDPKALGSALVAFTLAFGGLVRQTPTLEPERFEVPWRAVGSVLIRGRTIRVHIKDGAHAGTLCFRTSSDEAQRIVAWRLTWSTCARTENASRWERSRYVARPGT